MKKQVYEIDENGYLKNIHVIGDTEDTIHVTVNPPQGLYRAKWIGQEWVEDMTQKEIDELNNNQPLEPSENDVLRDYVLDVDFRLIMAEIGL